MIFFIFKSINDFFKSFGVYPIPLPANKLLVSEKVAFFICESYMSVSISYTFGNTY